MNKELKVAYLAKMDVGKTYAVPKECMTESEAEWLAQFVGCKIVRLPSEAFNLAVPSKKHGKDKKTSRKAK